MEPRLNKDKLLAELAAWDQFLGRKVHFIACGGTAMTLMDVKESTRDIDFIVPVIEEYDYVIKKLKDLGYQQVRGWGWQRPGEDFIRLRPPGHHGFNRGGRRKWRTVSGYVGCSPFSGKGG